MHDRQTTGHRIINRLARMGCAVMLALALAQQDASAVSATGGDNVTTNGGYVVHMFTNAATSSFNVLAGGNVEVLLVGGGGGGGCAIGGGGGGGGVVALPAVSLTEETTAYAIRRQMASLPDDPLPRLVLANPGTHAFSGWTAGTVYVEGAAWCRQPWRLLDETGRDVPFQNIPTGAGLHKDWLWGLRRLLVKTDIPANGLKVFRLDLSAPREPVSQRIRISDHAVLNDGGTGVDLASWRPSLMSGAEITSVGLHLIDDSSDTWSHFIDRYAEGPFEEPVWSAPRIQDMGPLMGSILQDGMIGKSRFVAEWRVYADEDWVDLILDVLWADRFKVLKLVLPTGGTAARVDGTPGMALNRANDGKERPLQDYTCLGRLGVVCPEVFALDATPAVARFTLLRSPFMACHAPQTSFPGAVVADQGTHRFRFRFFLKSPVVETLATHAMALNRPPLTAELTRGMPARWTEYRSAKEIAK